jgi:hypothetical protein
MVDWSKDENGLGKGTLLKMDDGRLVRAMRRYFSLKKLHYKGRLERGEWWGGECHK